MSVRVSQTPGKNGNLQSDIGESNLKQDESTAKKLLKFASTWQGDDIEECLKEVYKTRGETSF